MHTIDIILIVLLVAGAARGYFQGFISQFAALAALLLGIWGAIQFSDFTAAKLTSWFHLNNQFLPVISFAVTFAVIVVAVHFLGKLAEKLVTITMLGFVNNILGMVFGFLKYALIISVILVFVENLNKRFGFYSQEKMEQTIVFKHVSRLAPTIYPYLNFEAIASKFKKP